MSKTQIDTDLLNITGTTGIGVTPAAWSSPALQVKATGITESTSGGEYAYNAYQYTSGVWKTIASGGAARYGQAGDHRWYIGNATAGAVITWNQAMTLDTNGNLGVGATPLYRIHAQADGTATQNWVASKNGTAAGLAGAGFIAVAGASNYSGTVKMRGDSNFEVMVSAGSGALILGTNGNEAARFDTNGNLMVGTTTQANGVTKVTIAAPSSGAAITVNGKSSAQVAPDIEIARSSTSTNVGQGAALQFSDTGTNTNARLIQAGAGNLQFFGYGGGGWAEHARIDINGNFGVGVAPMGVHSLFRYIELAKSGMMSNINDGSLYLSKNAYYDGSWRYKSANSAMNYIQDGSGHAWMIASAGAATGNVITWTQAMTLDTAGRLGIGTSNPASPLSFGSSKGINSLAGVPTLRMYDDGTYSYGIASGANGLELSSNYSLGDMRFFTGGSTAAPVERVRIDNTGNLLVGETSGGSHVIAKNVTVNNGSPILQVYKAGTGIPAAVFFAVGGYAANSANSAIKVGNDGVTSRSISAGGTINASGADYAEYMTKADDCGVIAKGQIVGVNADGKLTDKWADAVSFLIKSTDPSYVGGDVWGTAATIGMDRPVEPVFEPSIYAGHAKPGEAPIEPVAPELPEPVEPQAPTADDDEEALAAYTAAHDQYLLDAANYDQVRAEYEAQLVAWHEADQLYQTELGLYELDWSAHQAQQQALKDEFDTVTCPAYEAALAAFDAKLEEARQRVDRIAYCGQVPVNVSGATPGQYVVPAQNGTGIKGILVDPAEMTLTQYMAAVGVVQNILPDGRANVRVKVV